MGLLARLPLCTRVGAVVLGLSGVAVQAADDPYRDLRAQDPDRRRAALIELADRPRAELAEHARRIGPRLRRLLAKDDDPVVRGRAAVVLALSEGAQAADVIGEALAEETDGDAARTLLVAVAELPAEAALAQVSPLAMQVDDLRGAALGAEALGYVGDAAGRAQALALLRAAPRWPVVAGVCLGLSTHPDSRVVDALVQHTRHADPAARAAAVDALARLCGVDHGTDPTRWRRWWDEVRDGYEFPTPRAAADLLREARRPALVEGTTDQVVADGRPTHARFFGIELRGRRIAFVIDYSQSMWGAPREKAEAELVAAVKGLPSDREFSVILFNEHVWWFGDGPKPALPQQKFDLTTYLPEQKTRSYTNVYDSLTHAFGLLGDGPDAREDRPGVDEIVFLSDGEPNRGRIKDPDRILEAITELNRGRVVLHTVSLGASELDLLPELAARNGGRHVAHPFPE